MSVLVTGGAGYIGSHVVLELLEAGEESVPDVVNFIRGDVGDEKLVTQVIAENGVDAIIHLSGSIVVPDSVRDPLGYYFNNTCKSRSLLACAVKAGLKHFLFSSSAAVYDAASQTAVTEEAELRPISPYGRSKLMTEIMLRDTAIIHPQLTRSSFPPRFLLSRSLPLAGCAALNAMRLRGSPRRSSCVKFLPGLGVRKSRGLSDLRRARYLQRAPALATAHARVTDFSA